MNERQRRRDAAVRIPGGDPDNPGRHFHKPSTGLRDSGFREGYRRALEYALFAFGPHLDEIGLAKAEAILNRLGTWEDAS